MAKADVKQVAIAVRAIWLSCWRCNKETIAIVGVHTVKDRKSSDQITSMLRCSNPIVLKFAQEVLDVSGMKSVSKSIKERTSRVTGVTMLTNGCQNCDALQGNFFLYREELLDAQSIGDGEEVFIIAALAMLLPQWNALLDSTRELEDRCITRAEVIQKMFGNIAY